tara:strand:- start:1159 stop:1509 length:351 start_codon:yes stop_codon:yes gene_type:complete
MTKELVLSEDCVVDFTNLTTAYVTLPKHTFFHNVAKNDAVTMKKKVTFAGKFESFATRYIVKSVSIVDGITTYTCMQLSDNSVEIEYEVDTRKPLFRKPYKIVGRAERRWEVVEMY